MFTEKNELKPVIDSRKSFYKKAYVIREVHNDDYEDKVVIKLQSYSTIVAEILISDSLSKVEVFGTYSMTTLRHIKDFLYQYGFEIGNRKFIEETYMTGV